METKEAPGSEVSLSNQADIGAETLGDLLSRLYGLQLLKTQKKRSWANQIYHVTVAMDADNDHIKEVSENGYLLKIINTDDSISLDVHAAHADLLSFVAGHNIRVTRPVPTTDGRRVCTQRLVRRGERDPEGEFIIMLLDYCPDVPLSEVHCWRDLLHELGAELGKLHTALQGYGEPRLAFYGWWNRLTESPCQRMEEALKCCYHDDQRVMIRELEAIYNEILPTVLPLLRKGVLHGDYRMDNVIAQQTRTEPEITGNSGYKIAAIIDFNDGGVGHYVMDVGNAVADVIRSCHGDEERLALARRFMKGYLQEFSLSDAELDSLYVCVCLRILGHATTHLDKAGVWKFVAKSWDVLKFLLAVGNPRFRDDVCKTCDAPV